MRTTVKSPAKPGMPGFAGTNNLFSSFVKKQAPKSKKTMFMDLHKVTDELYDEIHNLATFLGISVELEDKENTEFLSWLLSFDMPQHWERTKDPQNTIIYFNSLTGQSSKLHPLTSKFKELYYERIDAENHTRQQQNRESQTMAEEKKLLAETLMGFARNDPRTSKRFKKDQLAELLGQSPKSPPVKSITLAIPHLNKPNLSNNKTKPNMTPGNKNTMQKMNTATPQHSTGKSAISHFTGSNPANHQQNPELPIVDFDEIIGFQNLAFSDPVSTEPGPKEVNSVKSSLLKIFSHKFETNNLSTHESTLNLATLYYKKKYGFPLPLPIPLPILLSPTYTSVKPDELARALILLNISKDEPHLFPLGR